jgi:hypothetical protein
MSGLVDAEGNPLAIDRKTGRTMPVKGALKPSSGGNPLANEERLQRMAANAAKREVGEFGDPNEVSAAYDKHYRDLSTKFGGGIQGMARSIPAPPDDDDLDDLDLEDPFMD